MTGPPSVRAVRIYAESHPSDGLRILVDHIWPRGVTKEEAHLDQWCKAIAPSAQLRKWYGHDPARTAAFLGRYQRELADPERAAAFEHLRALARTHPLTLLTATKRIEISHAQVLADLLNA